jgi:hypothetical protein
MEEPIMIRLTDVEPTPLPPHRCGREFWRYNHNGFAQYDCCRACDAEIAEQRAEHREAWRWR